MEAVFRKNQRMPAFSITRCDERRSTGLVWSLVFLLFAQTLIPMQAHTRLAKTTSGLIVEMCTLQKHVKIDALTGKVVSDQGQLRTAATAFSDLLTSAISGIVQPQPVWLALVSIEQAPATIGIAPPVQPKQQLQIRAPPYYS